jgi:hypothetical protein
MTINHLVVIGVTSLCATAVAAWVVQRYGARVDTRISGTSPPVLCAYVVAGLAVVSVVWARLVSQLG